MTISIPEIGQLVEISRRQRIGVLWETDIDQEIPLQ